LKAILPSIVVKVNQWICLITAAAIPSTLWKLGWGSPQNAHLPSPGSTAWQAKLLLGFNPVPSLSNARNTLHHCVYGLSGKALKMKLGTRKVNPQNSSSPSLYPCRLLIVALWC
jgi:hypothetical protein